MNSPLSTLRRPSPAGVLLTADRGRGVAVVTVTGDGEGIDVTALRTVLCELIDSPACPAILLDLSAQEWIDSRGLGVLIDAQRRLNAQKGRMVLVGCSAVMRRAFEITRLVKVFELAATLEEAKRLVTA